MNITLKTPEKVLKFTEIFKNLKNLIDEINMVVTEEKLYMQGMDSTHALLFELEMKKQWFDEYSVVEKDTFGIHCETFFKIINCSNNGQYISMNATPEDDSITIMFEGENQISKIFELSRIELDDNDLEIPDVEYEADIGFDSNVFSELIKETAIFNDTINFKCNEETIQTAIALGSIGLITLLAMLISPLYFSWKNKHWVYVFFILLTMTNFLTEAMLETQSGVIFYAFFNTLFFAVLMQQKHDKSVNSIIQPT